MAAGLSLAANGHPLFQQAFEQVTRELLSPADLEGIIETDGELAADAHTYEFAREIENGIWGQGFPAPLFVGEFDTAAQRVLKEKHLKLKLQHDGEIFDAMHFFHPDLLPPRIRAVYALMSNEYNGNRSVQLRLHHWEPVAGPGSSPSSSCLTLQSGFSPIWTRFHAIWWQPALGLLIGLERERNPSAKVVLRTFALTALSGVLASHLAERTDSA
jgi:hypothetical protein